MPKKSKVLESKEEKSVSVYPNPDTRILGDLKVDIQTSLAGEYASKKVGREIKLKFEGLSVDASVINCLRRIISSRVPVYGMSESTITITKNGTGGVFDDDYMRQRISMIHIKGVKSKVKYLEPAFFPYVCGPYGLFVPEDTIAQEKDPKDKYEIKLQLKVHNKNEERRHVTTNDLEMYVNGEKKENPFNKEFPGLILDLGRGQEFHFTGTAVLGIAQLHRCWACIAKAIHERLDGNLYILTVTGLGFDRQLDEYTSLIRSCDIISMKLEMIHKSILEQIAKVSEKKKIKDLDNEEEQNDRQIVLVVENEDHSLGDLISTALNRHKHVKIAGYCMPHPNEMKVKIGIHIKGGSLKKTIKDTFNYLEKLFKTINTQLTELRSKSKYNGEDTEKEGSVNYDKYCKFIK